MVIYQIWIHKERKTISLYLDLQLINSFNEDEENTHKEEEIKEKAKEYADMGIK